MTTRQPSHSQCDEHVCVPLRQQADSLNALERQVAALEQQKLELQHDLDRLRAELSEHQRARDEWDWLFEHAIDMMLIHDEQGNVARASPSVEQILGFTPAELIERGAVGVVHPDDLPKTMAHLDNVARGRDGVNFVTRCRHKNGEWRWIAWTTPAPRYTAGERVRSYSIGRDITMSKLSEELLLYRAEHDALTGLANRARFDGAVEHALALAERSRRRVGLLLIDLDGFKAINDLHGHQTGDEVLKAVAARFIAVNRKGDLAARLGGDEFACLMEDVDIGALDAVAARILAAVQEPVLLDELQLEVGCSIGIACWPDSANSAHDLFKCADKALYRVKNGGKRGFQHYRPHPDAVGLQAGVGDQGKLE